MAIGLGRLGANVVIVKLKDVGVKVQTIIETARIMLEEVEKDSPCAENKIALCKLKEAIKWLDRRKEDREENLLPQVDG